MAIPLWEPQKCNHCDRCVRGCPFDAIVRVERRLMIEWTCRACGLCEKLCPTGAISIQKSQAKRSNLKKSSGFLVYAEHAFGQLHPISLEMIGIAKKLAFRVRQPVFAIIVGSRVRALAKQLCRYGIDGVLVYEDTRFDGKAVHATVVCFENAIKNMAPNVVLIGGTEVGRSIAPRIAARFRSGLTADCTELSIDADANLIQIRPAFGGNIMAKIMTRTHRPQFATVRYKVMDAAVREEQNSGELIFCDTHGLPMDDRISLLNTRKSNLNPGIEEAKAIVAIGRGVKDQKDMAMIERLARLLGASIGSTRGPVEDGKMPYTAQIGLSGRTVKPKLFIACGISGAIQFIEGMRQSECIMAINSDPDAPIFRVAHYGFVGDLYQVIPRLIKMLEGNTNGCSQTESR